MVCPFYSFYSGNVVGQARNNDPREASHAGNLSNRNLPSTVFRSPSPLFYAAHKCTASHADVSRKVAHGAAITHGFLSSVRSELGMVSPELSRNSPKWALSPFTPFTHRINISLKRILAKTTYNTTDVHHSSSANHLRHKRPKNPKKRYTI